MFTETELHDILHTLLTNTKYGKVVESETIEFKEAAGSFSFEDLGKYFSALSNEANLHSAQCGWLIMGISDKGIVVGTQYMANPHSVSKIKKELADFTPDRFGIREIYDIIHNNRRVVMIEIPPAPKGTPISFKGHFYGRDGESLVPLSRTKLKQIENQVDDDWSAHIITEASLDDLDPQAIDFAREKYTQKFPHLASEIESWDNQTFLNKSKITIDGKITRTALLLLGKSESEHFLSPGQAKIKWILKNQNGDIRDYFIITCPLLLSVNEIYQKIINLKYRYLQEGTLFPEEVDQYDPYIIREALHNAIAHQDYSMGGSITIVQNDDTLQFSNLGYFIPRTIERVILNNSPETRIRNKFLATAMFNIKMVDTIGSGIRRMFEYQKHKYFPMPDYLITDSGVEVSITGKVLDINYATVLMKNKSLSLLEIMMLDKVQKRKPLTNTEIKQLRMKKLIEGRKPNLIISSSLAASLDQKIEHARIKGLTSSSYETIIMDSLNGYSSLTRKDVDGILDRVFPSSMTPTQKKTKVNHLLTKMHKEGKIFNDGTTSKPRWILRKNG